jgi:hypothetical protein
MTYDEEYCLHNELGSVRGESREGETHESNVKPVTGQFELLGQTLQPCETWRSISVPACRKTGGVLTDVYYDIVCET